MKSRNTVTEQTTSVFNNHFPRKPDRASPLPASACFLCLFQNRTFAEKWHGFLWAG